MGLVCAPEGQKRPAEFPGVALPSPWGGCGDPRRVFTQHSVRSCTGGLGGQCINTTVLVLSAHEGRRAFQGRGKYTVGPKLPCASEME